MTTNATQPTSNRTDQRSRVRIAAAAGSVAAALLAWVAITGLLGVDLTAPAFGEDGAGVEITARSVLSAGVIAVAAGWVLLTGFERWTARPRVLWTTAAVIVFLLSLGGPLSGAGVGAADRFWLTSLHAIVAGVYIPLMARTITSRRRSTTAGTETPTDL